MLEPLALAHRATSSIEAAGAYWLCSRRVSTFAVAVYASTLSGIDSVIEGVRGSHDTLTVLLFTLWFRWFLRRRDRLYRCGVWTPFCLVDRDKLPGL